MSSMQDVITLWNIEDYFIPWVGFGLVQTLMKLLSISKSDGVYSKIYWQKGGANVTCFGGSHSCINLPGLSLSSLGALDKKQSAAK